MEENTRAVEIGIEYLEHWLNETFEEPQVTYLGVRQGAFHGWLVDFGPDVALRLGATLQLLVGMQNLKAKLQTLKEDWFGEIESESKWIVLNAVGIVSTRPEDW